MTYEVREKDYARHTDVWIGITETQKALEQIRYEGQRSTGHAFVCFRQEHRRHD